MTSCASLTVMAQRTTKKNAGKHGGGRPRRFKNPEQMQQELAEFFAGALGKDADGKDVVNYFPTIMYAEYKLGYKHRDYKQYEEFSAVTEWADDASHAICEQLALKGVMASPAIKLYLISKCGYTGDVIKMQNQQRVKAEVDISGVVAAIGKLNDEEEAILMDEIRKSLDEEEDEANEE